MSKSVSCFLLFLSDDMLQNFGVHLVLFEHCEYLVQMGRCQLPSICVLSG